MSVCDRPWSRRRRRRRWPRNSLALDIANFCQFATDRTSQFVTEPPFLPVPAGAVFGSLRTRTIVRRWRAAMSQFDHLVAAPPGRFDGISRPYGGQEVERL